MVFGKGFSADTNGGWKNHYKRMRRWEVRSLGALNDLPASKFSDAVDFSLAYFLWCHSLRDWLKNDNVFTEEALQAELAKYEVWPLCRDIANRVRHLELRDKPTDKDWSAYREYDPFAPVIEGHERHIANIMFNGKKWRISDAIKAASDMWEEITIINRDWK